MKRRGYLKMLGIGAAVPVVAQLPNIASATYPIAPLSNWCITTVNGPGLWETRYATEAECALIDREWRTEQLQAKEPNIDFDLYPNPETRSSA